ncbi:MAG: CBS domain-containing protein, partial [Pyrobaculum sp.]
MKSIDKNVQTFGLMKVGDLVKRPLVTIHVDATVEEAAAKMATYNIGAVVIV